MATAHTSAKTTLEIEQPPTLTTKPKSLSQVRGQLGQWWRILWPPALVVTLIIAIWALISFLLTNGLEEGTFAYRQQQSLLPAPYKVLTAFFANADSFVNAARVTLTNALIGFVLGAIIGYALALLMAQARWVERTFYVYIVASQMIPVIALAPILYGIIKDETLLKVTVAAYLTFFPVTVNVLKGLRSVNPLSLELMHTYAAKRGEVYLKLRIPASLPFLFNALKIASTGSLIGAIVSELMGGNEGIGVLILKLQYSSYAASDRLWALIILTALIGMLFFGVVSLCERWLVPWQPEYRKKEALGR
jgi:NitT/TauT family transport system permease protein